MNKRLGRGKALEMVPTPLSHELANRSSTLKLARSVNDLNAERRKLHALKRLYKMDTPAPAPPSWPEGWDIPTSEPDASSGELFRWSKNMLLTKRFARKWREKASVQGKVKTNDGYEYLLFRKWAGRRILAER